MMIHDFDLARYYAGKDEFVSIFATGSNISNKYFNKLKDFELATAILKTKNGVQCIISCLLYTSPSPRDREKSRMPSSA